jgi:PKD repeat protein/pimeloyl-ACP methyl ester carboxylesterase
MKRVLCLLIGLCGVGRGSLLAQGTPPLLEKAAVQTTASAERSTLNRTTGELSSTVEVVAVNGSGRRINGPVHAVVSFKSAAGAPVTAGVKVSGSEGGFGQAPWQQPWFDLTAQVGEDGWQPGEALRLPLTFSRNRALQVLYEVAFAGRLNRDPVVDAGGPYSGQVGAAIVFSGAAEDADGDALTFAWDFGDGTQAQGPQAEHAFSTAGAKNVRLTVDDGNGGVNTREVTALVIPSGQFALAHTRVVEGAGHPLAGAVVEETGPQGSRALPVEDSGFVSLGAGAGEYLWKFSAPGHLPVWRKSGLAAGDLKLLPSPWLAAQGAPTPLSVLEPLTLTNPAAAGALAGAVRVVFPAGAFTQPGEARLTALGPQVLPFPLAFGWSPLAAFHLDLPEEPTAGAGVRLKLSDVLAAGELVTIVQFDRAALAWKVVAHQPAAPGKPDECTFTLTRGGTWAAVVRDTGTGAPELPDPGDGLVPGTAQNLSGVVTAIGSALPPEKAASLDPEAVTGEGEAVFTPAAGILPSGSWFRLGVQESYDLTDGTGLRTPDYDLTVYAYRRPAGRTVAAPISRKVAAGAAEGSVSRGQLLSRQLPRVARAAGEGRPAARFPLRPRLLFSTAELKEAKLHVEVLPPLGTGASVLSREGGVLESGGLRVTVPPDALGAFAAGSLRALEPTGFAGLVPSGYAIAGVFELNLSGLAPGAVLGFSPTRPVTPATDFMLTRLISFSGGSGLSPVQRLRSDAAGLLTNAEPSSPPRLPGLDGPGQYLLVRLPAAQGLVHGVVRNAGGDHVTGISVRVTGQSWLSVTSADGCYFLTLPAGQGTVIASNSINGDGASGDVTMPPGLGAPSLDLTIGSVAPQVLVTTPVHQAERVASVTPLIVEFSEKIAPASLGTTPVTLRAEGAAADVPTGFTLDLSNRILTLLPVNPLEPATDYTLTVSAGIRDLQNLALAGRREFTFTTAAPAARGEGAQLVIYEPGGAGPTPADQAIINAIPGYTPGTDRTKVVATGGPGTADPVVPVLLVNESTGTTATVLSKPDGSFANCIEATEEDFISATFVNANGTRITIPATRQKFDDGRTGLFRQGGILEAESDGGGVQVIVEPQSIPARTVFKLGRATVAETLEITKGAQPEEGKVLGGVRFEEAGDPTQIYSDLVFPVNTAEIGLPAGADPAKATFALTVPRQINGTIVFEIVDGMTFRETGPGKGELVTQSPPFVGLLLREIAALREATGLKDGLSKSSFTLTPGTVTALVPVGIFLVPVFVSDVGSTNMHGTVFVQTPAAEGSPEGTPPSRAVLAGAVIRLAANRTVLKADVFRAGDFVGTSDREGKYAMQLPSVITKSVVATHRRFPGQTVGSGVANAGAVVGKRTDFTFLATAPPLLKIEDNSPPSITVSQLSLVATLGEAADAGLVLDEVVTDNLKIGETSGPKLESFTSLIGSNEIAIPDDEKALLEGAGDGGLVLNDTTGLPTILHRQWHIRSKRAGRATYVFSASDVPPEPTTQGGATAPVLGSSVKYTVVFTTAAAPPATDGPPRVVSFAWPPNNAENIARGTPLVLRFSRSLSEAEVARLYKPSATGSDGSDGPWLITNTPNASILHFEVSPDRRELTVAYWLKDPALEKIDFTITDLTVAESIPKIAAPAETKEGKPPASQFTHQFSFGKINPLETGDDATLKGTFGGVVQQGAHAWVLERGTQGGKLLHYELERDGKNASLTMRPANTHEFPEGSGRPMDLVLIPGYALKALEATAPKEENYLVVFAGPINSADPALPAPKRAHIFRISTEGKPEPLFVGGNSPVLTSTISQITRGRWDPPFLSYMEIGETTPVTLLSFNGLVQEAENRKKQLAEGTFFTKGPPPRINGLDANNDGDFADLGEVAPNRGVEFTWEPLDPNERVVDYDFSADFGLMGAALRPLTGGDNVFAMVLGGSFGQVDDTTARVSFPHAAKRIKMLPRQRLIRPATTQTAACAQLFSGSGEQEVVRDIVLVSCIRKAAAAAEKDAPRAVMVIIDITDPRAPVCLATATMPLGISAMNSIIPRSDGLLAISATGGGLFLLDPTLLLLTGPGGESAAIRQQIPGLSSNVNTFASSADGINIANEGTILKTAITQPKITVFKPRSTMTEGDVKSSQDLVKEVRESMPNLQGAKWDDLLAKLEPTGLGGNAGIFDHEKPKDPQRHFYVVVNAAGLSADKDGKLPLAAAAITSTGLPLLPSMTNRAPTFVGETAITKALVGYAAIKAAHFLAKIDITGEPASIAADIGNQLLEEAEKSFLENGFIARFLDGAPTYADELVAHRLSDEKTSPLYNTYLAGPIVLLHQDAPKAFVNKDNPVGRVALRASPFYWVGLAPTLREDTNADPFVGAFASKQFDDLDLSLASDATPAKVIGLAKTAAEALINPTTTILAVTQIGLQLSTLVSAEFERTFEPGHVALVSFGFRRNPVVFIPGVMASRLINPAAEDEGNLRWLSLSTGARAHAREFLASLTPASYKEELCKIDDKLNARIAELSMKPVAGGGQAQPVVDLDTEDILRTVGLGDIVEDLANDSVFQSIKRAIDKLLNFFGADFSIDLPFSEPLVKFVLNKINKPVYEPLLLYLNGYLGMDEYRNNGRSAALRRDGSPNWKSLRSGPELFVFPFDWRLDNAANAEKLARYVDLINLVHPDSPKVDLLCHSMGGLIARRYVLDHPGRVDRFISISSPYLGAVKPINAMKSGDMGEMTMSVFVPEPRMKIVTRHMPAVHQLLATKGLLDLGLPVLRENGWDLDGDGDAFENLDYSEYSKALDGSFFRVPADEIDASCATSVNQNTDRLILQTQPRPIAANNEPFHFYAEGRQDNWSNDASGVRYTHFVCLQNEPATIIGMEARPVFIPEKLKPDISLTLPPVDFFDSEELVGNDLVLLPDQTKGLETDPNKTFRISWLADPLSGGGDGTVPFLSQSRGMGLTVAEGNLNASDALMFPILNPKDVKGDDALAGHNDCMRNPQLWAWVGKALQDEIIAKDQPRLSISGGGGAENEPLSFTAVVTDKAKAGVVPAGREAPVERIVWDMGDGAVVVGPSATHTYSRAGTYTVSCTLSYEPGALVATAPKPEPGKQPETPKVPQETLRDVSRRPTFAAVHSKRIVIANSDPALRIEGPAAVAIGPLATFRANLSGLGSEDGRRFEWDFGDGTGVDPGDADNYVVQHAFQSTGTFEVKLKMKAEDGTIAEATKAVTVSLTAPAPAAPAPSPRARLPRNNTNDGSGELIELQVTGHSADPDDIEIRHDGQLVHLGTRVARIENAKEIFLPTGGTDGDTSQIPAAQSITITRFPATVAETTIRLQGDRARLLARFDYFKVGQPLKCWYHRFGYNPPSPFESEITFTIRWSALPLLTTAGLPAIAGNQGSFTLTEAAVLPFCDERGPNINTSFDERTEEIVIQADDNAVLDGAPVGDGSELPAEDAKMMVGLPWPSGARPPADQQGDGAPCHPLEDTQVSQAITKKATRDAPPGAVVSEDRGGLGALTSPKDCPKISKELTDADIAEVKNAVQETFRRAERDVFFPLFLLDKNHLLIFEQGSGALLWKATNGSSLQGISRSKLSGVYVKGKSDNDYELFLPVYTDTRIHSLNPTPVEMADFVTLAHQPDVMEGDWYFQPPTAISRNGGRNMGPPPDPEDRDEYLRYVSAASDWVYRPPGRPVFQVSSGQLLDGQKPGDKSVFDHPATPAQVLSALLTHTVARDKTGDPRNPGLRDILPDVSFFPFRREHFEMGMMSLEKPPPFGDDPIGDAGMGRQSLLLKWVLEGAFLPPRDGFNAEVPDDLAKRTAIYQRLLEREDLFGFEGFEWGIYQQWAVQREAATFRMRPQGGAAAVARDRCRQVFGSFLDSHDDKVMKKLGKACIRAALGRMMADDAARRTVLGVSPGFFDTSSSRRSYEHVVLEAALQHLNLFEGFEARELNDFLGAKLGDSATLCEIRAQPGGVDAFIARCFQFLGSIQEASADRYAESTGLLERQGRVPEMAIRQENAIAIDRGFTGLGGDRFGGRAEMAGLAGNYEHRYSFVVSLSRNTNAEIGPLAVTLERSPEDLITCLVPTFPLGEKTLTLKHVDADKNPALSILRQADDFGITKHKISLDVPAAENGIPENDTALIEGELLDLPVSLNEELVPRPGMRWVYRGLELPNREAWLKIESDQLAIDEFWSPSRLAGITDRTARTTILNKVQARIDRGNGLESFTNADLRVMTEDQRIALSHLGQPPNSLGISTGQDIEVAIRFAEFSTSNLDVVNPNFCVLVAMEVPVDEGIEYVNTSINTPRGAPVAMRLNPDEGNEVVFLGTVPYARLLAWHILPLKTPALNGNQTTRLRPYSVIEFLGDFRSNPNP